MFTFGRPEFSKGVIAVIAAAIVAVSGLAMDKSDHRVMQGGGAGERTLTAADALPGVTRLPEVVVRATRLAPDGFFMAH